MYSSEPPAIKEACTTTQHPLDDLNDDGRDIGSWKSRWTREAIIQIRIDAIYVGSVLLLVLGALVLTWRGDVYATLAGDCLRCNEHKFQLFLYMFLGGMLGGTLFGLKYLYKVVARGLWNIDRRLWRLFSPFISGALSLTIGALLDSGLLGIAPQSDSITYYFSVGFITGYFADSATGKMQEIATTIFGQHK